MRSKKVRIGIHIFAFMLAGYQLLGMYPFVVPFFAAAVLLGGLYLLAAERGDAGGPGVADRWNPRFLSGGFADGRRSRDAEEGAELVLLEEKNRLNDFAQAFLSLEELLGRMEPERALPDLIDNMRLSGDGGSLLNAAEAVSGRLYSQRLNFIRQLGRIGESVMEFQPGCLSKTEQARKQEALLGKRLRASGSAVEALWLEADEEDRYRLYLKCAPPGDQDARTLAEQAGLALGRRMCCREERGLADCRRFFSFVQEGRFRLTTGIARRGRTGEGTCGDLFSVVKTDPWHAALMLSDGMGSGEQAAKQSRQVLELLEALLAGGVGWRLAVQLSNASLSFLADGLVSATLDLAMIDLWNGTAEFVKLGASAAFIRRGDRVECFRSGSLPAGLLEQAEPDVFHRTLRHGDMIVMISDGVPDSMRAEDPERLLSERIASCRTDNAQALADRLMQEIGGRLRDDCTILAAGIWKCG